MHKLHLHNGWLCQDDHKWSVPLLASTVKVLRALKEKLPGEEGFQIATFPMPEPKTSEQTENSNDPSEIAHPSSSHGDNESNVDDLADTVEQLAINDVISQELSQANVVDESRPPANISSSSKSEGNSNNVAQSGIAVERATDEAPEGKKRRLTRKEKRLLKKNAAAAKPKYAALQALTRGEGLGELLLTALTDIMQFKERDYAAVKNKGHVNRNALRKQALEHQRERLKKQKEVVAAADAGVAEDAKDGDDADNVDVQDEDGDDEKDKSNIVDDSANDEEANASLDPWLRLAMTLNSLQVLAPIALNILLHRSRDDVELTIGKHTLKGRRGRQPWWLLGQHVYDIFSAGVGKRCLALLSQIWLFMNISDATARDGKQLFEELSKHMQWVNASDGGVKFDLRLGEAGGTTILEDETLKAYKSLDSSLSDTQEDERHQKYLQAIDRLHHRISDVLKAKLPLARVSVYGSCLCDLNEGHNSDVDLSLSLNEVRRAKDNFDSGKWNTEQYQREMRRLILKVTRTLEALKSEFGQIRAVVNARVPVVKGTYKKAGNPYMSDGFMQFDICFLNDIAVANSLLIREYTLVDPRVKKLMMAVKQWAKDQSFCSAADNSLSSYAWINMVIFYLQMIGFVPNLQSASLKNAIGNAADDDEYWHSVDNLRTHYVSTADAAKEWSLSRDFAQTPITALLHGFFRFYAEDFPLAVCLVSINQGRDRLLPKTAFRKCSLFMSIEDPFETADSYIPHDLCTPVNVPNREKIVRMMRSSLRHINHAVEVASANPANAHTEIWPNFGNAKVLAKSGSGLKKGKGKAIKNTNDSQKGPTRNTADDRSSSKKGDQNEFKKKTPPSNATGKSKRIGRNFSSSAKGVVPRVSESRDATLVSAEPATRAGSTEVPSTLSETTSPRQNARRRGRGGKQQESHYDESSDDKKAVVNEAEGCQSHPSNAPLPSVKNSTERDGFKRVADVALSSSRNGDENEHETQSDTGGGEQRTKSNRLRKLNRAAPARSDRRNGRASHELRSTNTGNGELDGL